MTPDDDIERRLRELLHDRQLSITPAPDALDRVRAGVRRRHQHRLLTSSVAAIAVIAVAAAGVALRSHVDGHSSTVGATGTPSLTASPAAPKATKSSVADKVPADFSPDSFTAIGTKVFYLLGHAPCTSGSCPQSLYLFKTIDGGQHFQPLTAPAGHLDNGDGHLVGPPGSDVASLPTIADVRFGDQLHGWAYRPGLVETDDGGKSWQTDDVAGNVVDLVTQGKAVWIAVDDPQSPTHYTIQEKSFAPSASDTWKTIATGLVSTVPPSLAVQNAGGVSTVTVLTGESDGAEHALISQPNSTFADHSAPCDQTQGGTLSAGVGAIWLACASTSSNASALYVSTNAGVSWTPVATTGLLFGTTIGGVDPTDVVVAGGTGSGLPNLYTVKNDGTAVASRGVSPMFHDLGFIGFTTASIGYALPIMQAADPSQLWRTSDGGRSWSVVKIAS